MLRSLLAGVVLTLVIGRSAAGQGPASAPACLDSIPASALKPTVVYLWSRVPDSMATRAQHVTDVNLFTQSVAEVMRAMLDSVPGRVAAAEPTVEWRDLEQRFEIRAGADGRVTWRELPDPASYMREGRSAGSLLARALERMAAQGDGFIHGDTSVRGDIQFKLMYRTPERREDGTVTLAGTGVAFPVFTVQMPWQQPLRQVARGPDPSGSALRGLGPVTMSFAFIVGADGRIVPESLRDATVPSADERPRVRDFRAERLASMRDHLDRYRFEPRRFAGCAVATAIEQVMQSSSIRSGTLPD